MKYLSLRVQKDQKIVFIPCRIFGARRCSKCLASISSSELVMRAKQLVFHVSCFSCEVCNTRLTKGDQFGIKNSSILCRLHFEKPPLETQTTNYMLMQTKYNEPLDINTQTTEEAGNIFPGFYNSPQIETPQQPRQKGRPRKRKHKDIERMTANLGNFKCLVVRVTPLCNHFIFL